MRYHLLSPLFSVVMLMVLGMGQGRSAEAEAKEPSVLEMERLFEHWEGVLSLAKQTDVATLCIVFDLDSQLPLMRYKIEEAQLERFDWKMLLINAESLMRGVLFRGRVSGLSLEGIKGSPRFICVLMSQHPKRTGPSFVFGFKDKETALAFAEVFRDGALRARRIGQPPKP